MRVWPVLALALILFAHTAHAALQSWDVDISLNDDRTSNWTVSMVSNDSMTRSDYFVLADVTSYRVLADEIPVKCELQKDLGTLIVCNSIDAKNITYQFTTAPTVSNILQNFHIFTRKLTATQLTNSYSVTVRLPLGSVLADAYRLQGTGIKPVEPDTGQEGSDGRTIFVKWYIDKPTLGETLNIAVVYEQLEQTGSLQMGAFAVIFTAIVAGFIILIFIFFRRQPIRELLPVMSEGERFIMQILLRENGSVDQRQLVRETDFSKAKVSRIIQDLGKKGVIEKVSKGRKNLIKLKKSVKIQNKPQVKKEDQK